MSLPVRLKRMRKPLRDRTRFPHQSGGSSSLFLVKSSHEHSRQRYPSDLTDQEWTILEPLIPPAKPGGRPRMVNMRQVINAILYLDRTGCQWRALPHDFPQWPTVWTYFRTWRNDGTWERIHTVLREQVRVKQGREPTPSAAIIDSQSVKTSQKGGGAATTEARRSKAASAISWWIPTA